MSQVDRHNTKNTAYIINHTHWDREWFTTSEYTSSWLRPLIDNLLKLLERNPCFRYFFDGQTLFIADLLERNPEYRPVVQQLLRKGALVAGPYYCQPDWRLACGHKRRLIMKIDEFEAKMKTLEETIAKLETREKKSAQTIKQLETRITRAEDIEAIKKLQRAYGFYLEHWEEDQLIGLFSKRDDVTIEINDSGEFRGPDGVKQCYVFGDHYTAYSGQKTAPPEYLHLMVPISGIVDVAPDGKTAQGQMVRYLPWCPAQRRETPGVNRVWNMGDGLHQRRWRLEDLETLVLRYFQQPDRRGLGKNTFHQ